jgi:hypothetical protein
MSAHTPSRGLRRPASALLLPPILLSLLVACGGGGGDDPAPAPPASDTLPSVAAASSLDDNRQIGATTWADGSTTDGGQGLPVQGVPCGAPVDTYHVHSHLSIFVDGQAMAVPANIGLIDTAVLDCHYEIHSHDRSGKIHVEAAGPFTATLGQFFAIWGQPLEADNVAGQTGKPVVYYLVENGQISRYQGDPAAIELTSHRHVVIQIGSTLTEVPYFTWSGN